MKTYFKDKHKDDVILRKEEGHFHVEKIQKSNPRWEEICFSHPYTRDYYSKEMRILICISEREALKIIKNW